MSEITPAGVVAFFRAYWIGMAVVAVATFVLILPFLNESFSSSALLLVVPPAFSSDLGPKPLTVQGYQSILEAQDVVERARQRLVDEGVLEPEDAFRLNHEINSRIFVSSRAEEKALSPVLEAIGTAATPEAAAAFANIWAEVFLERVDELIRDPTAQAIELIESEYPKAREAVHATQAELLDAELDHRRRVDRARDLRDQKLAAFEVETAELIAAHQAETRRLMRWPPTPELLGPLEGEKWDPNLQGGLRRLFSLRRELAQTSRVLDLEKAPGDDLLAQVSELSLRSDTLVSQELNPAYAELEMLALGAEEDLRRGSGESWDRVAQLVDRLSELQQERAQGLSELRLRRSLGRTLLQRDLDREVDALREQRDVELKQIRRRLDALGELDEELTRSHNNALLARAQEGLESVRLAVPAVPARPSGRSGWAFRLGLVAIASLLVGLLFAFAVEAARRAL